MSTPAGYKPVTGTILDSTGAPVTGTLVVTVTDGSNAPWNATVADSAIAPRSQYIPITAGILATGTCVPDTTATNPVNVSLRLTIYDSTGRKIWERTGIQTPGATLDFGNLPASSPLAPYVPGPPGIPGPVGPAGPVANFRGAYAAGTNYAIGDAVSSGGSSWVSLVAGNTGNTPSTSPSQWGLLAAAGSAGTPATASVAGVVQLATGQTSSQLAAAATTGFVGDIRGAGRLTFGSFPNLARVLAEYNLYTRPTIYIVSFGSSISVGATLPNAVQQAPGAFFAATLIQLLDPSAVVGVGGNTYSGTFANWQFMNYGVNGGFAPMPLNAMQYAPSSYTVASGGSGYAPGDHFTVEFGASNQGTAIGVVLTVDGSGKVLTAMPSAYPNVQLDTFNAYQYVPANAIATYANSAQSSGWHPAQLAGVALQEGTGTGLTVNITQIGFTVANGNAPTVAFVAYGMNDFTLNGYNGLTGYNFSIATRAFASMAQTLKTLNCDTVYATTPHFAVATQNYNFTGSFNVSYPPGSPSPATASTIIPSAANATITGDWTGNGTQIALDTRFFQGNRMIDRMAAQNGAAMIDGQRGYIEAYDRRMAAYIAANPSLTFAEAQVMTDAFYFGGTGAPSTPHFNLQGHEEFYGVAIKRALSGLTGSFDAPTVNQILGGGNYAVNLPGAGVLGTITSSPSQPQGVWDIYPPYADTTTPPLRVSTNTGPADGSGNPQPLENFLIEPTTGDVLIGDKGSAGNLPVIRLAAHPQAPTWIAQAITPVSPSGYGGTCYKAFVPTVHIAAGASYTVAFQAAQAGGASQSAGTVNITGDFGFGYYANSFSSQYGLGASPNLPPGTPNTFTVSITGTGITVTAGSEDILVAISLDYTTV